jgi:hypothetical protein
MNDARQAASENLTAQKQKSPMATWPPGWLEVRDMLLIGFEQRDLDAS